MRGGKYRFIQEVLKPIEEINLLEEETLTKHGIVDLAQGRSDCLSKVLRVVGYFMLVFGLAAFFSPLTSMLGYIPLLGGILQGTANFLIFIASLIICLPLFLLLMSVAWLFYHPKVGIPLLVIGIIGVGILIAISIKRPPHPIMPAPGYSPNPYGLPGPAIYNTPVPYVQPFHLRRSFHHHLII